MKISRVNINCRRGTPVNGICSSEYTFVFIRTPAVFRTGGNEHRCTGKSVIIYKSGTPMFYRSAENIPLQLDSISFKMNAEDLRFFSELDIPFDTPIYPSETVTLQNILKTMQTELICDEKLGEKFSDHAMRLILINISIQLHRKDMTKSQDIPYYNRLMAIRKEIYDKPMHRWSIDDICAELGISRTYFHRIYQSAFGVTCMQDVIESRLTSAADMLINTNYSIGCIAELCGYESDSYFMRQFKKHTGCTPSEYRRKFSHNAFDIIR